MTAEDESNQRSRSVDKTHLPLRKLLRVTAVIFAVLLAISYLIAIPIGLVHPAQRLSVQEIILASAILISLAFVAQSEYTLKRLHFWPLGHQRSLQPNREEAG
jgi:hypothetical protein